MEQDDSEEEEEEDEEEEDDEEEEEDEDSEVEKTPSKKSKMAAAIGKVVEKPTAPKRSKLEEVNVSTGAISCTISNVC